jgi:type III restriction enzyme
MTVIPGIKITGQANRRGLVNLNRRQGVKLVGICSQDSFEFHKKISPKNTVQGITKNLYVEEGEMNDFEKKVINEVANLDSVVFWHRNLERGKGFQLNGFINHYPDFIVKMKNGKIILIETKGDHLDGSDSSQKIRLGEKWASKAGDNYRYFMVFNNAKLGGAKSIGELIEILKDMR